MWIRAARYREHHPRAMDVQLAIEVSQSSLAYDLEDKRRLHALSGICEYWIVDAIAYCIHVFLSPEQGDYSVRQVFKAGEKLAPQIAATAQLDLSELFLS